MLNTPENRQSVIAAREIAKQFKCESAVRDFDVWLDANPNKTELTTSINLKPFLCTDESQTKITSPFSIGKHTYATDGHIIIRVPTIEGVDVVNHRLAKASVEFFAKHSDTAVRPLIYGTLPAIELEEITCGECGTKHMTPKEEDRTSVSISGVPFNIKYIRLLQTLPSVNVQENPVKLSPMYFTFDGGEGILKPLSCTDHWKILEVQL